jgi:stearoyl-CoA desaturase (Delta-9 desaturase)
MTLLDDRSQNPTGPTPRPGPKPVINGYKPAGENVGVAIFVIVPFLALLAAVPLAWGWGLLHWSDVWISAVFFVTVGTGVTVGFHRYFTHGSFKAKRPLRLTLAVAGSMAIEGSVIRWVADHRRHHAFSDREGDPHSPWRFGNTPRALMKGLAYAHVGWLFGRELTNEDRFAPDLVADKDIRRIDRLFPLWVAATLLVPALIGGLVTWSWAGALTAFFWAGLVRVSLLHHITWSINSICHTLGERPYQARDKSANFWPLAILSFGESWHNSHHADPTCARHGVQKGQLDVSARIIWFFEKCGWVYDVRWPKPERFAKLAVDPD